MKRLLLSTCMFAMVACNPQAKNTASSDENFETLNIIPMPVSATKTPGSFVISSGLTISSTDKTSAQAVKTFTDKLEMRNGVKLSTTSKKSAIDFITVKETPAEGYDLQVTKTKITLKASDSAGFLYGMETLYQLMPANTYRVGKKLTEINVDCAKITDVPAYKYRGIMLDVCRHYMKPAEIKRVLDVMVSQKLNTFHWHLTEDQAWRIEIKKYPKLTSIGAWRDGIGFGLDPKRTDNYRKSDGKYGGFYTQEEIKDIIKYASERSITIIPEIELPGHAMAALVAYPELGCTGGPYTMPNRGGVFPHVYCAGNEKVFTFLQDVISEVAELFPSKYIHIGGDECPKSQWKRCPKCQKVIKDNKLHNEHELQSYFITRMEKFINSKGKKLIGWDEILEGGLAPNATVMSWRGMNGGIKAANMGHDVIMTPNSHVYFDHYQAKQNEPKAIGGFLPLERVYTFNPAPKNIASDKRHHILGGQANLWTEYMPNGAQVEYMLAPRVCALSESVWSDASKKDWNDFSQRMKVQYSRFEAMGINYRRPSGVLILKTDKGITLSSKIEGQKIVFTLDGSTPTKNSTVYTKPITESKRVTLKASILTTAGILLKPVTKGLNLPKFSVKNDFGVNSGNPVEQALDGSQDSIFWGNRHIKAGNTFTLTFEVAQTASSIRVITGKKVDGGGDDSLKAGDQLETSIDGKTFTKVANFDNRGVAKLSGQKLKVKAIRLKANKAQNKWLVIREIEIN